jgi:creatinine amidohydrolase
MPSRILVISLFFVALFPLAVHAQQPSSRSMDDLNWQEFRQLVPAKIKTVILTVGTLEAHGFINNGADNTVPVGLAHSIAADVNALIAPHIPTASLTFSPPIPAACEFPRNHSAPTSVQCSWAS